MLQKSCSMVAPMFEMWLFNKSPNFSHSNRMKFGVLTLHKYWLDVASTIKLKFIYSLICYWSWSELQSALPHSLLMKAFDCRSICLCLRLILNPLQTLFRLCHTGVTRSRCEASLANPSQQWRWLMTAKAARALNANATSVSSLHLLEMTY